MQWDRACLSMPALALCMYTYMTMQQPLGKTAILCADIHFISQIHSAMLFKALGGLQTL